MHTCLGWIVGVAVLTVQMSPIVAVSFADTVRCAITAIRREAVLTRGRVVLPCGGA